MPHLVRRSLLVQLLSVYLLFVIAVLIGGVVVNLVVEQRLYVDAQASNQALAQEIATETSIHLEDAESAVATLGNLTKASSPAATASAFEAFQAARRDVDQVYWLGPLGDLRIAWPPGKVGLGSEFAPPDIVALARTASGPVFDVGVAAETTIHAGVIIAYPVNPSGRPPRRTRRARR